MNRYEFTAEVVRACGLSTNSVLDVGCRDAILKRYIDTPHYYGVDVDPDSSCDAVVDISKPTPFEDQQFDLLVALDVAEHTDNMHAAVCEMLRVSANAVIALPNMYHFAMRWRFLAGRPLSDKYALTRQNAESGGYRHRWLFTPAEAERFMRTIAAEKTLRLDVFYYYPPSALGAVVRLLGRAPLSAETLFYVFRT